MASATSSSPCAILPDLAAGFFQRARPRELRGIGEFAEGEVRLGAGPNKGLKISLWKWQRLVLEEAASDRWMYAWLTGAVQSSKTTIGLCVPLLYYLFECEEDVGLGAPTIALGDAVYRDKVEPTILDTRYRHCLPQSGRGSKGGKVEIFRYSNGARLYLLGAGGGDEQRSSHTMRVIIMTELDKMDTAGSVSREANPVRQMAARVTAYGEDAKIVGECTVSTEDGFIWRAYQAGTRSEIYLRCPKCKEYVPPRREQLVGWQDAESVSEARRNARYRCQACGKLWDEAARAQALDHVALVHAGQTVATDGTVSGQPPDTDAFSVRWTAVHSPLVPLAEIAAHEWNANVGEDEDEERYLCQFVWSIPHQPAHRALTLSMSVLAKLADEYPFNPLGVRLPWGEDGIWEKHPLPSNIAFRIGAIDVQKKQLYWVVDGYSSDLTCRSLAWGVTDIIPEGVDRDPSEAELEDALNETLRVLDEYECETVWVDTSYKAKHYGRHVVRQWCNKAGEYIHALTGRGSHQHETLKGTTMVELPAGVPPTIECRVQSDGSLLWFLDVDQIKDDLYSRLLRTPGAVGCRWFAREAANERRTDRSKGSGSVGWILSHYLREKPILEQKGSRVVRTWKQSGRQDMFDLAVYSLGGAYVVAADLAEEAAAPPPTPVRQQQPPAKNAIRTEY